MSGPELEAATYIYSQGAKKSERLCSVCFLFLVRDPNTGNVPSVVGEFSPFSSPAFL